jgi:hypothetical protein
MSYGREKERKQEKRKKKNEKRKKKEKKNLTAMPGTVDNSFEKIFFGLFRGCRLGNNLLSSYAMHYICWGCRLGCLPGKTIFCKTFKLSYYFYIVKNYVMFNNW